MDKQKNGWSQFTRPRCLAALAVIMVGISAGGYVVLSRFDFAGSSTRGPQIQDQPSRTWAQPVELPGLPNLHKVSEDLYRGAQPTAEGMQQLKNLGVKTIINLRSLHSDRDEIGETKLRYVHIRMTPLGAEDEDVIRFLRVIADANSTPAFVHCQRGADRTGLMCAIYRIVVQDWSKADAIEEMTNGGFGFYEGWENLIEYINDLNIAEIRREASLEV
ncbi:MAG: tyrosine-protein phosphatase [Phycisphaerales bacterium]|nr:MAG: tyrosine-protein phosphatase [Phycisphaerales bacterium]